MKKAKTNKDLALGPTHAMAQQSAPPRLKLEEDAPHNFFEISASDYQEACEFNKKGLFIGGCPKSGTTLLLALLDSHPQLVVLPEETFYLEDRRHYLALDSHPVRMHRLLEKTDLRLLASGKFEPAPECESADARDYTNFDWKHFIALAGKSSFQPWINDSLLFSEMIRAYAMVLGAGWRSCIRWVEKSTSNEVRIDALNELFPDAKLIQIVRDPRAVFASRKKRIMNRYSRYTKAHRLVREWNRSAQEVPRLRRNPSRFLVIRYEDLVENPRGILETVCRFGGFDFTDSMFEPTRAGGGWQGNSSFQAMFNGISPIPTDLWKNYLSEDEIWWIELHCRKGMGLMGYPRQTSARFSLLRWLKRMPGESWNGYIRARRASFCQFLGLLKECRYDL